MFAICRPDDREDAAYPVWTGVLPIRTVLEEAVASPDLMPGLETPEGLRRLIRSGRLR